MENRFRVPAKCGNLFSVSLYETRQCRVSRTDNGAGTEATWALAACTARFPARVNMLL